MDTPVALREIPTANIFRKSDVFVLFGELFGRGYANGLVNEARNAGMTIIGVTVGRRDENNKLRPLTAEELAQAEANLGGRIINVPLMAGFDLDAPEGEPTPTDLLAEMTLKSWQDDKLDWKQVERCREVGVKRFKDSVAKVMAELDGMIPDGSNAFFAHTMAGGIPKVKVFLAIANRIYKGRGERFQSSNALLDSDLGKLILMNFDEVTANTFQYLIEGSAAIRARLEKTGGQVRYTAYGYHGTEILIDDKYQWQTYTNYTQGKAKMRLERIAEAAWKQGIKADGLQLPRDPHQLLRHLCGRGAIAVPPAQGLEERTRRGLGRSAVASLPRCAAGRPNAGKPAAEDRRLQCQRGDEELPQFRGMAHAELGRPGRSDDRHLGRDHQDAQEPRRAGDRCAEFAGAGRHRAADVP